MGAGRGVTTIPGLAMRSHRLDGVTVAELLGAARHIAATYGKAPDPPATAALLAALAASA